MKEKLAKRAPRGLGQPVSALVGAAGVEYMELDKSELGTYEVRRG